MKLSSIKPNEKNPRRISKPALEKLCESIKRDPQFMELRPIIVDERGIIIGGNQRYRACLELGMEEVPDTWIRSGKFTAEQRRRFIIIDNAPEGMAGYWDIDTLRSDFDLPELEDLGINFFSDKNSWKDEWQGMPEFQQDELTPFKTLHVHFNNKEDLDNFSKLINQKINDATKYIWYPEVKKQRCPNES